MRACGSPKGLKVCATAAFWGAWIAASQAATSVALGDPSFETNSIAAGALTTYLGPEWSETSGPSNANGFEEYVTGFAADGTDHLGMVLGHDVWQDLSVTYEANTRYTLTVAVGNRSTVTTLSGNQSQYLLADSEGTVYATGSYDAYANLSPLTFADAPALVLDTSDTPTAVGKTIRILLRARGAGRSHFDHIRLTAESYHPPGSATFGPLEAVDVTATSARLMGSITDVGGGVPDVTVYWGPTNGVMDATAWTHAVSLGSQTGAFETQLSGLTPGAAYFFTVRAVNGTGTSWVYPAASFQALPNPPQVTTLSAGQVTASTATLGAWVTSTGGEAPVVTLYYGPADGGTNPAAWIHSVSLGMQSGSATVAVTGLQSNTPYYCRAYAENSGGGAWAVASQSFTTKAISVPTVTNTGAEGVTGTTASLRGEVTHTENDVPVVTIFYGKVDGGTDPEAWTASVAVGAESGDFSRFVTGLDSSSTYYYRCRAVNTAGTAWAASSASFDTTAPLAARVVINEIHYHPSDNTSLEEFIELHNPGDTDMDLSGWTLQNAVDFTFPSGTVLPAAGYLVVAESPSTLLSKYGVTALGPWTGNLSSDGETVDMYDAAGVRRDRVGYGAGFPWPTGADGAGGSAELIHPALDNDLGGSWRSSGAVVGAAPAAVTYIAASSTGWRYKKGSTEASSPVDAWRDTAYGDSAWLTGTAAFGYHTSNSYTLATKLTDMRKTTGVIGYTTVYYRKSFTVAAGEIPDRLKLRLKYDDGVVVWINGHEVARRNVAAGQLAYNAVATADHPATAWEEIIITGADDILIGGTNVITVHSLNQSITSSDYFFDLELATATASISAVPTPGARNSVYKASEKIPPQIRQVSHTPQQPAPGVPVSITAKITDPEGVGTVTLLYQTVDPGSYIRLTDTAYTNTWTQVPMADDGANGDAVAGDSTFTAVLPADLQTNRRLVRYRIQFSDGLANTETAPYADDEQPNFAYYVAGDMPAWSGSFNPGTAPIVVYPAEILKKLPVYTLIANGTDVINCQYASASDGVRFPGTFVYDGVVYDHVHFRNRGEGSTYVSGKNKWRFYFNRSRDLEARDNYGVRYAETWSQFSGDACACPWAALHRGMAGVEEALSYKIYQLAGVPSPNTHYYHFRVVRGATETPAAGATVSDAIAASGSTDGQYAGDFWGLYLAVEALGGSFLDERALPAGNLYKIENSAGDKKYQGPTQATDSSDWTTYLNGQNNVTTPTQSWWETNLDLPTFYSFHAINRLVGNVDLRGGYNHGYYHRPTDGRWVVIPWDLDMMFIAKSHWTTSINSVSYPGVIFAHKALLQQAALALEYRNRARELLDLLASDGGDRGGQIGQLIHEFARIVHPTGETNTWANADAAMWNMHPRTQGTVGTRSGQTNHKGNFFWTSFGDSRIGGTWTRWLRSSGYSGYATHEDSMAYLRDYAVNTWPSGSTWAVSNGDQRGYGYQYLQSESADTAIPTTPVVSSVGAAGFPVNDLTFTSSAFSDPQGADTYASCMWRIAELYASGISGYVEGTAPKYEIQPLWTSGELTAAPGVFRFPTGITTPGKTYRVRTRHKDSTGRWSHWSEPIQFSAGEPAPSPLLHYWNFNVTTNQLAPSRTLSGAPASLTLALSGTAAVESGTGQGFAASNAREVEPADAHLRVNNPLGASLTLAMPTTGYSDLVLKYETRRSGQGAGTQIVSYALDGTTFVEFARVTVADATPVVQSFDFSSLADASNNPAFAVRITFVQGAGGTAGNDRFDNITLEGYRLPGLDGGVPLLIHGGDVHWAFGPNWSTGLIPGGAGAAARISAPEMAREVSLSVPVTIGSLRFENAASPFRNRISGGSAGALIFDGGDSSALVQVEGTGTGYAEFDVAGGGTLSSNLRLAVNNVAGDLEYGALRLRGAWGGSGGLIKQGAGIASLTGTGKSFAGAVEIEEGVLAVSQPASPAQASGVNVKSGGQLRLTSGDEGTGPRVYTLGGVVRLGGRGRGAGVPEGEQQGVLGALRYHPGSSNYHQALLTNPVVLTDSAEVHVDGTTNQLEMSGQISGDFAFIKSGGGMLVLSADHPDFAKGIEVAHGPLCVNGVIPADVKVEDGATLEGAGRVKGITGAGAVAPAATVLTADSADVDRFDFIFTRTGLPSASTPASSGNGLLHLLNGNALAGNPETVNLYLDAGTPQPGDRFCGGFFTPAGFDLAGALTASQVRLFISSASGAVTNRGRAYRPVEADDLLTWSVAEATLNFGAGPVAGSLLEIAAGGVPSSYAQWRGIHFDDAAARENDLVSGPGASAAGDGIPNFMRYAMGVGPYDSIAGRIPHLVLSNGAVAYRYQLDTTKTNVAWRISASPDMKAWAHPLYEHSSPGDPAPEQDGSWLILRPPASLDGGSEPDRHMYFRLELWPLE